MAGYYGNEYSESFLICYKGICACFHGIFGGECVVEYNGEGMFRQTIVYCIDDPTNEKRFRTHFVRNLFLLYRGLFTFAAAGITAETLVYSLCYKDGIAVGTHP